MTINVNILERYEMMCGLEVEVSYNCSHCGESIAHTVYFSDTSISGVTEVYEQKCPKCGKTNDLSLDMK